MGLVYRQGICIAFGIGIEHDIHGLRVNEASIELEFR